MLKNDAIALKADHNDVTNIFIERLSKVNVIIREIKKFKDLHLS
jgi:phage protein D